MLISNYHNKSVADLGSIFWEETVNQSQELNDVAVCWAQYFELVLLVSLLGILKFWVPESRKQ